MIPPGLTVAKSEILALPPALKPLFSRKNVHPVNSLPLNRGTSSAAIATEAKHDSGNASHFSISRSPAIQTTRTSPRHRGEVRDRVAVLQPYPRPGSGQPSAIHQLAAAATAAQAPTRHTGTKVGSETGWANCFLPVS